MLELSLKLIGYRSSGRPPVLPPKGDKGFERQLGTMTVRFVADLYGVERQAIYARYNSAELDALRRKFGKRK